MKGRLFKIMLFPLLLTSATFGCKGFDDGSEAGTFNSLSFILPEIPGDGEAGKYIKTSWESGDKLSANGVLSNDVSASQLNSRKITLFLKNQVTAPVWGFYPGNQEGGADLPGLFTWSEDGLDTSGLPLCGYSSKEPTIQLIPAYAIVKIGLLAGETSYPVVSVSLEAGVQVSGHFDVSNGSLKATSDQASDRKVTVNMFQVLPSDEEMSVYIPVPAGSYPGGITVTVKDSYRNLMHIRSRSPLRLEAGEVLPFENMVFVPDDEEDPSDIASSANVAGKVVDTEGKPVPGVVVSDGLSCTITGPDGAFYLESILSKTRHIFVSTPGGYEPAVEGGIPRHYRRTEGLSADELLDITFTLTKVNQDKFAVFFTADPQPRKKSASWDKFAYHSLDVCEDLYHGLQSAAAEITDRPVYGICLGDICHNDVSLFANYAAGLSRTGFPTYTVIGNHDHDTSCTDDESGAFEFEKWFGPANYSFNLGDNLHVVVLDNLLMKVGESGHIGDYGYGLTDDYWEWLQNDLFYVPTDKTLFICVHAPMFRTRSGGEYSTNTKYAHAADCAALFSRYEKFHAWAGHTHQTFNYVYPANGLYPGSEVHTLARSTGQLWTNEYMASGTPRGFTAVMVDGKEITWKFTPLKYQNAAYVPKNYYPEYKYRDWTYDASGLAILDGKPLDDTYQIHAYPKGSYGDDYVYANVFLYDDLWGEVYFTPDGGAPQVMTQWTSSGRYDLGHVEINSFYCDHVSGLKNSDGYGSFPTASCNTMFRIRVGGETTGGTVSVTDRFGNTWSRHVEW